MARPADGGQWTLTVALPAEEKGTHMSRFVALLEKYRATPMTPALFAAMAREMLPLLHAERGDITASFPYFINKSAPVSGVQSLLDYEMQWIARAVGEQVEFELVAQVPVTSLCPCSKAISEYRAHNQRSHVTVSAIVDGDFRMDELIRLVEDEASCSCGACSSGLTRSTSPSAPMTTPSSSRTWCATSPPA